jgi:hypothetical protein
MVQRTVGTVIAATMVALGNAGCSSSGSSLLTARGA